VDPPALRSAFESRLATRPASPSALRPAEPVARSERLRVVIVDRPASPQTVIRFVWPGIAHADDRRIPLMVASTVLGGTFTSRLNLNLREHKGYTYGAGSGIEYYQGSKDPTRGPSLVAAASSVRADVSGPSVIEFLREFERMRAGDITADEVAKARLSLRNARIQTGESLDGLVGELDAVVTFNLSPESLVRDLGRLDAVDVAAVNAAARELLVPDGGVLVLVGDAKLVRLQLADVPGLPAAEVVTADRFLSGK
jgi:predicted Zn-dependent peptidase